MQVIRNRPGKQPTGRVLRSIVTIGNFDGMHLGHQALIERSQKLVAAGESLSVVTFEPLPQALFRPHDAPPRLSTVYQKLAQFKARGVDQVWLMRFDTNLSRLSAREFVEQVLVQGLAATHTVVGADFRFGYQREGDVELLVALGLEFGFEVDIVPAVFVGEERVSSTAIRHKLSIGEFEKAAAMLGRPFRMEGHVGVGQQLGRKLGYPTANLRIRARPGVLQGVFAAFAHVFVRHQDKPGGWCWLPAVCSIGLRPTIGGTEPLLEVHFFDFDGDLYGQRLEVEFVAKLRHEAHFETIDQMVEQMHHDETAARSILAMTARPA